MANIHPKTTGAGLGGAVAVVIVFILQQAGVDVTPELAAALTTIFSFGASYAIR